VRRCQPVRRLPQRAESFGGATVLAHRRRRTALLTPLHHPVPPVRHVLRLHVGKTTFVSAAR
jgi:hypothetical protein